MPMPHRTVSASGRRSAATFDEQTPPMMHRAFRFAAWAALATVVFVTVSPIGLRPHDVMSVQLDRALAFGALAALFVFAYPRHWLVTGLAIVVAAIGIEWLQELSPTRHARLHDALIKAGGAACGVALAAMANLLMQRLRPLSPR